MNSWLENFYTSFAARIAETKAHIQATEQDLRCLGVEIQWDSVVYPSYHHPAWRFPVRLESGVYGGPKDPALGIEVSFVEVMDAIADSSGDPYANFAHKISPGGDLAAKRKAAQSLMFASVYGGKPSHTSPYTCIVCGEPVLPQQDGSAPKHSAKDDPDLLCLGSGHTARSTLPQNS